MSTNNVIVKSHEVSFIVTVSMPSGKRVQRTVSVQRLASNVFSGHITKRGHVTASWKWDMNRFGVPVYVNEAGYLVHDQKSNSVMAAFTHAAILFFLTHPTEGAIKKAA